MQSRWVHLKNEAVHLRQKGSSIKEIRDSLGIPLSTLSGWLKKIMLTPKQKKVLENRGREGLARARLAAVLWHNRQKECRIKETLAAAHVTLSELPDTSATLELALAFLYLGEGNKSKPGMTLGSSSPSIAHFYVNALEKLYGIRRETLRVGLHLRVDQDEKRLKKFWSATTGIPEDRFSYVIRDPRSIGKPTYPNYYGVCAINGGGVAIQRKLMYLAEAYCQKGG